jgi:hypothetical protein
MSDSGGILFLVGWFAVFLFYIYVGWRIYTKADQPGWAALIPIYQHVVLLRIVGRPMWWLLLLYVIPVGWFVIPFDLADSFGKGTGFGVGLLLLSPIFAPILALGDASYEGPSAADGTAPATA